MTYSQPLYAESGASWVFARATIPAIIRRSTFDVRHYAHFPPAFVFAGHHADPEGRCPGTPPETTLSGSRSASPSLPARPARGQAARSQTSLSRCLRRVTVLPESGIAQFVSRRQSRSFSVRRRTVLRISPGYRVSHGAHASTEPGRHTRSRFHSCCPSDRTRKTDSSCESADHDDQ